jgi:hypothetical protein
LGRCRIFREGGRTVLFVSHTWLASEVCVLGNSYDKGKIVLKEGLITITKYLEGENLKESEKKEINRNTRNGTRRY